MQYASKEPNRMPKQYSPKSASSAGGKDRWTDADRRKRAERGAGRSRGSLSESQASRSAARPARGERPDWTPREKPARAGYDRPRTDDRAPRREWNDRPQRDAHERPARSYQDRPARPHQDRQDRPTRPYQDRPARGERPDWSPREKPARSGYVRPAREDRAPRREWQPREDRPARTERPARPVYEDRAPRPRYDDRPARPRYEDRAPRSLSEPQASRSVRPATEDVVLDRLDAAAVAADAGSGMTFSDLGFGDNIVRQLAAMGASEPFPIQAATIPAVLAGRDVLGRGRTGSGKTIAFGAPIVERLLRLHRDANPRGAKGRSMGRAPRALILAPTRELAQQIDRTVQPIARSVGLFTIAIVGGVPYQKQLTGLQRGVDIVIGTPGRVEDLVERGDLDLSGIAISVLDEADHMCELGFLEPVQRIFRLTPDGSQRLLLSATLDTAVESLVAEFLRDPSVHEVEGEDQASSTIHHRVLMIDASAKRDVVRDLVASVERSIVFTRTRAFAEDVAEGLMISGIPASSLHGDLNQARRNRNLQLLSRGDVRTLVATDVAARSIHVDDIDLVIHADMAEDHKTYLHRSGRTGRAGAHGTVVTVISPSRRRRMEELLKNAGIEAEWEDRASPRPPRSANRSFREDRPYRGPRRNSGEAGSQDS